MSSLCVTIEVILPNEYLIHTHTIKRDGFPNNIIDTDILEIVLILSDVISVGINLSLSLFYE